MDDFETVWAPRLLSVLRIVAALIMLEHGMQKLFGFPPPSGPVPSLTSLGGIGGFFEFFLGLALLLGAFTRPAAFILSGEMAVAFFTAHFPRAWFPINNGGEAAIIFCFLFLYLAAAGGGVWSVDAARKGWR